MAAVHPDAHFLLGKCLSEQTQQKLQEFDTYMEQHYTWIQELLEGAKKTFESPEVQLLPKTPSAKRARQRLTSKRKSSIQKMELSEDDDFEPAKKPARKGRATKKGKGRKGKKAADEDELDESAVSTASTDETPASDVSMMSTRSTRSTRASTRSKKQEEENRPPEPIMSMNKRQDVIAEESEGEADACDTVKKKPKNKKKVKSDEEIANRTTVITDSEDDMETKPPEIVVEDLMSPEHTPDRTSKKVSTPGSQAVKPKPLPGFRQLNMKGKVQAFEEIINNSLTEEGVSPLNSSSAVKKMCLTPGSGKSVTPATPPTVVLQKHTSRATLTLSQPSSATKRALCDKDSTPKAARDQEHEPQRTPLQGVCKGTRLSLSKRRSSLVRHKRNFNASLTALSKQAKQQVNASLHAPSPIKNAVTPQASPARSCTRSKMRLCEQNALLKAKTPEPPMRSTRSKMRVHQLREAWDNKLKMTSTPNQQPARSTRSKMRQQATSSDEDHAGTPTTPRGRGACAEDEDTPTRATAGFQGPGSSMAPFRSTRSKMRNYKQKAAQSPSYLYSDRALSDSGKRRKPSTDESDASPPKRRCTEETRNTPDDGNQSSDSEVVENTPPRQPRLTRLINSQNSFKKKTPPCNINTTVTSFIQRNTPQKITVQERMEQKRRELAAKQKMGEVRVHRRNQDLQRQAEERRRMREERQLMAARRRDEKERQALQMRKGLTQKYEEKKTLSTKALEEKLKEEREKQKQREKKMAEAECRRKQEEEIRLKKQQEQEEEQRRYNEMLQRKKEFEEQERHRRLQEQRRLENERRAQHEREEREERERQRILEEQREKEEAERLRQKEERERKERLERERHELIRQKEKERQRLIQLEKEKEAERLRLKEDHAKQEEKKKTEKEQRELMAIINKHNNGLQQSITTAAHAKNASYTVPSATAPLNTTVTKDKPTVAQTNKETEDSESYEMTPVRKPVFKPSTADNYNIDDINSEDSTDDEEKPRKKIPAWATGAQLKAALINQFYQPPDLDHIFDVIEMPDLNKMFTKRKPRFNKRTSSAIWDSPILKPSGKLPGS